MHLRSTPSTSPRTGWRIPLEHGHACLQQVEAPATVLVVSPQGIELLVEGVDTLGGDTEVRSQAFVQDSDVSAGLGVTGLDPRAGLGVTALDLGTQDLGRRVDVLAQAGFEPIEGFAQLGIQLRPPSLRRRPAARRR